MFGEKDDKIFLQNIHDRLSEYDRLEMVGNGKHLEWEVCFDFIQDCKSMNMGELNNYHAVILAQDCTLAQLNLLLKYHWGLVYFRARDLFQAENKSLKAALDYEFRVCYNSAWDTWLLLLWSSAIPFWWSAGWHMPSFQRTRTDCWISWTPKHRDLATRCPDPGICLQNTVPATDPDHLYGEYYDYEVEHNPQMEDWLLKRLAPCCRHHRAHKRHDSGEISNFSIHSLGADTAMYMYPLH